MHLVKSFGSRIVRTGHEEQLFEVVLKYGLADGHAIHCEMFFGLAKWFLGQA